MNNFAMPRPDLAFGGPGQILASALQEQLASWAFYTSAVAAYGNQAPLQTLLDSTVQRITLLGNLYQQFGIPRPALASPAPEPLVTGWRESLERAMQGTVSSAGVYQQLVTFTPDPTLRRQLERLQSDLLTRDLSALQRAWQAAVDRERLHAAQGIDPAQAHVSHGVIGDAMEAFFALLTRDLPALQRAWQAAVDRERLHAAQGIDPAQAHVSHGVIGDAMEAFFALLTRQGGVLGFTGTVLRAAHPMLVAGAVVGSLAVQGGRHARILREQRAACAAACDCSGQAAPSDHPDETVDSAWSPSHDPEN